MERPWRWFVVVALAGIGAARLAAAAEPAPASGPGSQIEQADALIHDGAVLGRAGNYAAAIARFKAAQALYPRSIDHCNIGSAYLQAGLLPQAHLALLQCSGDAATQLFAVKRRAEVLGKLQAGSYARLELVVSPVGASVALSAFPPDESAPGPLELWLAPGRYSVRVSAPGHVASSVELAVPGPGQLVVTLQPETAPVPSPEPSPSPSAVPTPSPSPAATLPDRPDPTRAPPSRAASARRRWGKILLYAGLGLGAAGGVLHVLAYRSSTRASELTAGAAFEDEFATFAQLRIATLSLYALGAASAGTGVYLLATPARTGPRPEHVALGVAGTF